MSTSTGRPSTVGGSRRTLTLQHEYGLDEGAEEYEIDQK